MSAEDFKAMPFQHKAYHLIPAENLGDYFFKVDRHHNLNLDHKSAKIRFERNVTAPSDANFVPMSGPNPPMGFILDGLLHLWDRDQKRVLLFKAPDVKKGQVVTSDPVDVKYIPFDEYFPCPPYVPTPKLPPGKDDKAEDDKAEDGEVSGSNTGSTSSSLMFIFIGVAAVLVLVLVAMWLLAKKKAGKKNSKQSKPVPGAGSKKKAPAATSATSTTGQGKNLDRFDSIDLLECVHGH